MCSSSLVGTSYSGCSTDILFGKITSVSKVKERFGVMPPLTPLIYEVESALLGSAFVYIRPSFLSASLKSTNFFLIAVVLLLSSRV